MRKYLDELGIERKDTPEGWGTENDKREEKWRKQREEYGFDERETWSLDYTIKLFLYERIKMYNEVNIVDTSYHKFEYKDNQITFQECIDRILEGLRLDIKLDEWDKRRYEEEETKEKIEDWGQIFILCKDAMWW